MIMLVPLTALAVGSLLGGNNWWRRIGSVGLALVAFYIAMLLFRAKRPLLYVTGAFYVLIGLGMLVFLFI